MDTKRVKFFTSESVTEGHPDKVADQISDAILDAIIEQDPKSRACCETVVTTDLVLVTGEITTKAKVNYEQVVRETIRQIGYTKPELGFCADTCKIILALDQ
jgi:S-adenosylmethionine synthetase